MIRHQTVATNGPNIVRTSSPNGLNRKRTKRKTGPGAAIEMPERTMASYDYVGRRTAPNRFERIVCVARNDSPRLSIPPQDGSASVDVFGVAKSSAADCPDLISVGAPNRDQIVIHRDGHEKPAIAIPV